MALIIVTKIDPQPYKAYNIGRKYIITYRRSIIIIEYYITKHLKYRQGPKKGLQTAKKLGKLSIKPLITGKTPTRYLYTTNNNNNY
jgi:hypothetical protein